MRAKSQRGNEFDRRSAIAALENRRRSVRKIEQNCAEADTGDRVERVGTVASLRAGMVGRLRDRGALPVSPVVAALDSRRHPESYGAIW
jgi:hypothetical protein